MKGRGPSALEDPWRESPIEKGPALVVRLWGGGLLPLPPALTQGTESPVPDDRFQEEGEMVCYHTAARVRRMILSRDFKNPLRKAGLILRDCSCVSMRGLDVMNVRDP